MIREFESYLSNKKRIKDKYVPYYMKWVSDCYSYLDESVESRLPADRIQTFLSHLSKKYEDWQVNEADYALRLYQFFLSMEKRHKQDNSGGTQYNINTNTQGNALGLFITIPFSLPPYSFEPDNNAMQTRMPRRVSERPATCNENIFRV
jgi:hypothetical protein